jgi:hypothetical protein
MLYTELPSGAKMLTRFTRLKSEVGSLGGALLAPLTAAVSFIRQSRTFHPRGILCRAEVETLTTDGPATAVAARLSGAALVRFSSAIWKQVEWKDVLGCALRFCESPVGERVRATDQDLLFATIRRPWTMALSPLATHQHDFFANHYYAVSPFEVAELGRVEWRLTPENKAAAGGAHRSRSERFHAALKEGSANFVLEWARYRKPWAAFDDRAFQPLVRIHLVEAVDLDQEALRFNPFQTGRGLKPVGFIHSLRPRAYSGSQHARPAHQG